MIIMITTKKDFESCYKCQLSDPSDHIDNQINDSLLTRTSWVDASTALAQIHKGKASGNASALWLRAKLQTYLYDLGHFIQRNAGKVLFVGLLVLITFCVGLKSAVIETNVERLWVEEGGRLEKEMKYIRTTLGDGFGSTNQIVIQTPKSTGASVLHESALLLHLQAMKVATKVTVDMFEVTWRLKDICYSPSIPSFDTHYIDSMLENIFPCAIITPLDCFWEGAKLLGPEFPVPIPGLGISVQWTNLNPELLIDTMMTSMRASEGQPNSFPFSTLIKFMKRAGITSAYQKKPCLDPTDANCPSTAPNKQSGQIVDIGAELTGGCYGFATKFMHWPEDLIVGGVKKNKTGHIVKAKALQSIIQLMAEQEMYDFYQHTYKVHNLDWSVDKARMILEAWQRKFSEEVQKFTSNDHNLKHQDIHLFTSTSLMDIMRNFSDVNFMRVAIGYVLMLLYASYSLSKWNNDNESFSILGITGVIIIGLSVAAGLGFCALIGLSFNASTTQIIPFLALGIGVDNMFLLAHTYSQNLKTPFKNKSGECLKQIGSSILLTSFGNICAFLAAAIIPIPALRCFALQAAILIAFISVSVIFLIPAVATIDMKRCRANRRDKCLYSSVSKSDSKSSANQLKSSHRKLLLNNKSSNIKKSIVQAPPPDRSHVVTIIASDKSSKQPFLPKINDNICKCTANDSQVREQCAINDEKVSQLCKNGHKYTLAYFADNFYGPLLQKKPVKVCVVFLFLAILIVSISGVIRVDDGLDLTDIVPRNTIEYRFLNFQRRYFSFFNMFAVTQGNFEYPNNQKLLHEYHQSFTRVGPIIKNDDGGLPEFWLTMFRDWLLALQEAFDRDWKNGCITRENWFPNASDEGILAYKLLVQTGRVDNPVDKSLVLTMRLVDDMGMINPKAFYNYLTAWVSNDALAYSASQASFRPEPRQWIHVAQDVELKIPKCQPLIYAQMPFYLNNMRTTTEITETIQEIRAICQKFEDKGLPNFPTGIPFIYWEQYVRLRFYLFSSLVVVLAAIFVVISAFLLNPWTATLIVVMLIMIVIELFGLMGLLGIKLSAVPAVILIVSVGIGVDFVSHLTLSFLMSIGSRNHRMQMALQHMMTPVTHGIISTLFGILMLAFSEFDFIIRYFFYVLVGVVVLGALNGLLLLPVLLSIIGPPPELMPFDYEDRIPTPSPVSSPTVSRKKLRSMNGTYFTRRSYPRVQSEISLSTISEEQQSYHSSHEIVVQPEFVVETTTITNPVNGCTQSQTTSASVTPTSCNETTASESPTPSTDRESPAMSESSGTSSMSDNSCGTKTSLPPQGLSQLQSQHTVTTKVMATAKLKVEVHAPYIERDFNYSGNSRPNSRNRDHSRRHCRSADT
ncbi:protein patched-like [Oppia nitens]|uniref:protein patched-like n=1 Tax=Oppia nitens TaxID=1686743 RepID=UPI0023DA45F7|nr:protein patched-like [Oppia nitens]